MIVFFFDDEVIDKVSKFIDKSLLINRLKSRREWLVRTNLNCPKQRFALKHVYLII